MAVRNPGGGEVAAEAITTAKIANEAVTTAKIAANAVTFGKTAVEVALPAKPAEKAVSAPVGSSCRKSTVAITGDAAKTEWECEHSLFAWTVVVAAYEKGAAEKETKKNISVTSWESVSNTKTKVVLGAAVAAGTVAYIEFIG